MPKSTPFLRQNALFDGKFLSENMNISKRSRLKIYSLQGKILSFLHVLSENICVCIYVNMYVCVYDIYVCMCDICMCVQERKKKRKKKQYIQNEILVKRKKIVKLIQEQQRKKHQSGEKNISYVSEVTGEENFMLFFLL